MAVTDPINADAAKWPEEEIGKRFNQPIRHLVYSHDGADTAVVISHEGAMPHIVGEGRRTAVPQVALSDRMTLELGGKTVEEAKQLVTLAAYKDWGSYADWQPLHVEDMYRHLQQYRQGNE